MSTRTETLARRLEEGTDQLVSFAESLTAEEWTTTIPQEGRTVGVLVHHVATMFPLEMDLAGAIVNSHAIAGVTWDMVADINANHAVEHAQPDRTATVALLRSNAATAAAGIRAMSDEQLETLAPISLYGDAPLTLQFWLEDHPITHGLKHMAVIKTLIATQR